MLEKTYDERYREAEQAYRETLKRYDEIPEHLPDGTEKPHVVPVAFEDLDRERFRERAIVLLKRLTKIVERNIREIECYWVEPTIGPAESR